MQSTVCSCSPTIMHIRLQLSSSCNVDSLNDNSGIKGTLCLLGEAGSDGFETSSGGGDSGEDMTSAPSQSGVDSMTNFPSLQATSIGSSVTAYPTGSSSVTSSTSSTNAATDITTSDPFRPPSGGTPPTTLPPVSSPVSLPPVAANPATPWPTYVPTTPWPTNGDSFLPGDSTSEGVATVEQAPPADADVSRITTDDEYEGTYYPTPSLTYYPTVDGTYAPTTFEGVGANRNYDADESSSGGSSQHTTSLLERYYGMVDHPAPSSSLSSNTNSHHRRLFEVINMDEVEMKAAKSKARQLSGLQPIQPHQLNAWASIPPNDAFFNQFPEWKENQEELYRLRKLDESHHQSREDEVYERLLQEASVPTQLLSAQFLEIDTTPNMNIINQDDQYLNLTFPYNNDDMVLSFTSISATLDPAMSLEEQLDIVPGGVILVLVGQVEESGEIMRNRLMWTYSMGCGVSVKTVEVGDEFGWAEFDDLEKARLDFCPASAATPAPAPLTSSKPTKRPSSDLSMDYTDIINEMNLSGKSRKSSSKSSKSSGKSSKSTSKSRRRRTQQANMAEEDFGRILPPRRERKQRSIMPDEEKKPATTEEKADFGIGRQMKLLRKRRNLAV
eukprot:scaffold4784_cov229-Alexandrium_tamarense.AAC.3